jgi:hypothetical protein
MKMTTTEILLLWIAIILAAMLMIQMALIGKIPMWIIGM